MNKKINKIVKFLEEKKGYIKWGKGKLAKFFKCSEEDIKKAKQEIINKSYTNYVRVDNSNASASKTKLTSTFSIGAKEWGEKFESMKNVVPKNEEIENKLKSILIKSKNQISLEDLSNNLDISVIKVKSLLNSLEEKGFNIHLTSQGASFSPLIKTGNQIILDVSKHSSNTYKFGVCGDNHLCSKYERLDVLNSLYDIYKQEGITTVYNTGNWIDGEARFNKTDIHTHGMDNQIQYMIDKYPKKEGVTTYYISGDDHEGWYTQQTQINIGKYLEIKANDQKRTDLVFLGHMEADIILKAKRGETRLRVLHPGGGSSYAISYTSQKIVESYTGGDKPDILLDGHYHKAGYNYIRGVHVIQTGCTEDQTPFMRKKRLAAHLGGWIVEFTTDDRGAVIRFKQEFIPYFDKKYYKDNWKYKH